MSKVLAHSVVENKKTGVQTLTLFTLTGPVTAASSAFADEGEWRTLCETAASDPDAALAMVLTSQVGTPTSPESEGDDLFF